MNARRDAILFVAYKEDGQFYIYIYIYMSNLVNEIMTISNESITETPLWIDLSQDPHIFMFIAYNMLNVLLGATNFILNKLPISKQKMKDI